ncbi:hypothetical protein LFE_0226 [Leptospirillum ferrooxidans C2-3]|uniref:Uncharacterized protein n=1 Tax=Leptospirillum ferrooxidans (strain C2-3) TaxID=1162668 RepID=I0IL00_LEPFC|nr:hypothetical protein LFE_0226 [Leptospirillum ferrooxidans C2-3]
MPNKRLEGSNPSLSAIFPPGSPGDLPGGARLRATECRELRQVRKEATVTEYSVCPGITWSPSEGLHTTTRLDP